VDVERERDLTNADVALFKKGLVAPRSTTVRFMVTDRADMDLDRLGNPRISMNTCPIPLRSTSSVPF